MQQNHVKEPATQRDLENPGWTKEKEVLLPKEFIVREIDDERE